MCLIVKGADWKRSSQKFPYPEPDDLQVFINMEIQLPVISVTV